MPEKCAPAEQAAIGRAGRRLLFFLLASASLFLPIAHEAGAQEKRPIVFLGDKSLPPYEFLEDGVPKGANVDLLHAIGAALDRPVEIRLLAWDEAQKKLLAGEGDALTMLGKTPGREPMYDFSVSTLPVVFALFVRAGDEGRFKADDLAGKRIGVIQGGFPASYIAAQHPDAIPVPVPNGTEGARLLLRGRIDALAANQWSQLYLLKELSISGIRPLDPFERREGNIAVREGDTALLQQIDEALLELKSSGELDRIVDRWSTTRVHLLSADAVRFLQIGAAAVALLLILLVVAIVRLRSQKRALALEIQERARVETEREQVASALRAREHELHEADRRKNEFLATLAHELRNPLAPIRTAIEIQQLTKDPATRQRAQDVVVRQVAQLVHLVEDLLDIGRIATGNVKLRKQTIDIADASRSAVESVQPKIEYARHTLALDLAPEPLLLQADLTRLTQVIANLLSNAAKYTPSPGRISLATERQGGEIVVTVCDNGIGIPSPSLERVFDMFSQVDKSLDRSHEGLGIGLALVRKLVELHGGTVQAFSEGEGKGATFVVRLPALPIE